MSVRVRFAPSPTGFLHVGGLRTALYNYLFAKHFSGKLILRIEDTDRSRFVEGAVENLITTLSWARIEFDESPVKPGLYGPYTQSERLEIYKKHTDLLIQNGWAYYAFDTPEEIEIMRKEKGFGAKYDRNSMKNQYTLGDEKTKELLKSGVEHVIRLKVPQNELVKFQDIIRGEVVVSGNDIDDQVLIKSDGFPTYHLANVVDDYLMKITHVIRGEEWLPSTPKHVLLYKAFGWDMPEFAHLPLLLNPDKSKLSKRQGDVAVEDYIAKGYFRDAIINFVALLGWNPTSDRELYSIQELIDNFHLEKVNKGGAVFDIKKLLWMNGKYLQELISMKELTESLAPMLEELGIKGFSEEYIEKIVILLKERVCFLHEIPDLGNYLFFDPPRYNRNILNKVYNDDAFAHIVNLNDIYRAIDDFKHDIILAQTKKYLEEKGIKLKNIIHLLRTIITGKTFGAGMFETMEVIGKDTCVRRIDNFIELKNEGKI